MPSTSRYVTHLHSQSGFTTIHKVRRAILDITKSILIFMANTRQVGEQITAIFRLPDPLFSAREEFEETPAYRSNNFPKILTEVFARLNPFSPNISPK
jgi:hypothetical protein